MQEVGGKQPWQTWSGLQKKYVTRSVLSRDEPMGTLLEQIVDNNITNESFCLYFQEVVSLKDALQCHPDELPQRTGQHLSPEEWHATLHEGSSGQGTRPVLLDARNIYETRVGHFKAVRLLFGFSQL